LQDHHNPEILDIPVFNKGFQLFVISCETNLEVLNVPTMPQDLNKAFLKGQILGLLYYGYPVP